MNVTRQISCVVAVGAFVAVLAALIKYWYAAR